MKTVLYLKQHNRVKQHYIFERIAFVFGGLANFTTFRVAQLKYWNMLFKLKPSYL